MLANNKLDDTSRFGAEVLLLDGLWIKLIRYMK